MNSILIVNKYFENLVFTRLDKKSTGDQDFFIYAAAIAGRFEDGTDRYVLLMVPSHLAVLARGKIHDLSWDNLQTRRIVLSQGKNLPKQSWKPSRDLPDVVLEVVQREETNSMYRARDFQNFPFDVLLLHNPIKKTKYQYRDRVTLSSCLESFSSSIVYRGFDFPQANRNEFSEESSYEIIPEAH